MAAFPDVEKIRYEGPDSTNPLAFHWYNEEELVEGKTMKEQMRFSVVYWHTFRHTGMDPFGSPTMQRPWEDGTDSVENAIRRARVAFEFMEKLGTPYYAFHDRDVAPEGGHAGRVQQEPGRGRGCPGGRTTADRDQAALGHCQPVQ
jgi:xylose isomerase